MLGKVSNGRPVLVTGSHRSGSTWLAGMLGLARGTLVAHEPFNIQPWAYSLGGLAKHWFTYAPGLPQDDALRAFGKVLDGRSRSVFLKSQPQHWVPPLRRGRLVIKDPIAALSSDWLAKNFDLDVVVLVRHPAAFAASLKRLGWEHPFEHFLEQEALMRDHLEPRRAELERTPDDPVGQAGVLWNCVYGVLFSYLRSNPHWIVRRHEDLSGDPAAGLEDLYGELGLRWTGDIERKVRGYTGADNPASAPAGVVHQMRRDSASAVSQWKNILTAEETARIREATRPLSEAYYADEDWAR